MSNASAKNVNAPADIKKKSQFVEVWKRLCRNKTAVLGLVIVALLTLMAILSPILIDYETQVIKTNYSEALQAPSADHWFGTDEMGRDILLRVIEHGTLEDIFKNTRHPYTEGLFNSLPNLENRQAELKPIKGLMPDPSNLPKGCAFCPRCEYAMEICKTQKPPRTYRNDTHYVECHLYNKDNIHEGKVNIR